jgi:N-acetyltransferase 10
MMRSGSNPPYRYEIEAGAPGWAEAEKQVLSAAKSGQKNPVVSVKSSKSKRKAGETAAEIYEQELGEKAHKKAKKGSKKSH